ncbi:MAG: hypothetical protein LBG64_01060 [Pseudomonadales bacterium]|jgi:DNA polymerase III gamma/tau subunit|nr:hypothetical protein [Pseudomonadales bacterium]
MSYKHKTTPLLIEIISNLSPLSQKEFLLEKLEEQFKIPLNQLTIVNPDETLKIDEVRWLTTASKIKGGKENKKFFLLRDIDKSRPEAQNALLKLLEEPPSGAFFILSCANASRVLDTIKSRCQLETIEYFEYDEEKMTQIATDWGIDDLADRKFHELIKLTTDLIKQKNELFKAKQKEKSKQNTVKIGRKVLNTNTDDDAKNELSDHQIAIELLFELLNYCCYQVKINNNPLLYANFCRVILDNYRLLSQNVNSKLVIEEVLFKLKALAIENDD